MKTREFLKSGIEQSGKTQAEIAREVGYDRSNFISMLKSGDSRLPLEKVPAFAAALGIDAGLLLRLALREYQPETYAVIVEVAGPLLTQNERALVELYRQVAPLDDLPIDRPARELLRRALDRCRATRPQSGPVPRKSNRR